MAYPISKTGFGNLPRAAIQIDYSGYTLTEDNIVSGNYSIMTGEDLGTKESVHNYKFLVYNGSFTPGTTVTLGTLVLLFKNKAKDSSGKKYDVRVTYNATMEVPANYSLPYLHYARVTQNGILQIASVHDSFPDVQTATEGTTVAITVDILEEGTAIHASTLFAVADIDVEDLMNFYYGDGQKYGVDGQYVLPYQEQVRPGGTVLSPIYMEPDTLIITNAEQTIFGGSATTTSLVDASVAFLVQTPIQVTFACSGGAMILFTQASDFSQFTIVSSAGPGGSISPNGSRTYDYGTNGHYEIATEFGYEIEDVEVDGVSIGPVSSYTFTDIKANHTIVATFVNVIPPCSRAMGDIYVCGGSRLYMPEECEETP